MLLKTIARGVAAGAAGTTALNTATYLDMATRARSTSDSPQRAVEALAGKAGVEVPGSGEGRDNRVAGLGPLLGVATGTGIGALGALLHPVLRRLPAPVGAFVLGAGAMLGSDAPMIALGLAEPRDWSAVDWLSDVVPHLAYGVVTYACLAAMRGPRAVG